MSIEGNHQPPLRSEYQRDSDEFNRNQPQLELLSTWGSLEMVEEITVRPFVKVVSAISATLAMAPAFAWHNLAGRIVGFVGVGLNQIQSKDFHKP